MKQILIYLSLLLLAVACQKQKPGPDGLKAGTVQMTFSVTLPDPTPVQTRAGDDPNEVQNVDLLVFDADGLFVEHVEAAIVPPSSAGGLSILARATLTSSLTQREILIIGNGRGRIDYSFLVPGRTIDEARALLVSHRLNSAADIMPLIMSGEVTLPSLNLQTSCVASIRRAAACIQVGVGGVMDDNGLENFELMGATLNEVAAFSTVMSTSANDPMIQDGMTYLDYHDGGEGGYWSWSDAPVLYCYERFVSPLDENPGLIIKGKWKGMEGFYKVRIGYTLSPVNIVRNHRYIVKIVKAEGPGHRTVREAAEGRYSNVIYADTEITNALESITHMVTNGQDELGITNNRVELWGGPGWENRVWLGRAYCSAANMASTMSYGADVPWLNVNLVAAVLEPGWFDVFVNFRAELFDNRIGTVFIRSGDMAQTITVEYKPSIFEMATPTSSTQFVFPLLSCVSGAVGSPWEVRIETVPSASPNLGQRKLAVSGSSEGDDFLSSLTPQKYIFLDSRTTALAYLYVSRSAGNVNLLNDALFRCNSDAIRIKFGHVVF